MAANEEELTVQQRAEIQLNRINVALAKNQRILQSFLPARNDGDAGQAQEEDTEDDFRGMTEAGGILAKNAYPDEGMPDGAFKRYDISSSSKLLEQMIGKKVAQARLKEKERGAGKASSSPGHAAPGSAGPNASMKRKDESEDEEEGRAATFRSKKVKISHENENEAINGDESKHDAEEQSSIVQSPSEPLRKKKPTSYLDELLASKKGKKKKH